MLRAVPGLKRKGAKPMGNGGVRRGGSLDEEAEAQGEDAHHGTVCPGYH